MFLLYSKGQKLAVRGIVKNRFLQETPEVFGGIASILFEIFDEVRLVKKIIIIANIRQRFGVT